MAEDEKIESCDTLEEKDKEKKSESPKEKKIDYSYKIDDILDILNSVFKNPSCLNEIQMQLLNVVDKLGSFESRFEEDKTSELEKYKKAYPKLKSQFEIINKQNEDLHEKCSEFDSIKGTLDTLKEEKEQEINSLKKEKDEYLAKYNQQIGIMSILEKEKNNAESLYKELSDTVSANSQKLEDLEKSIEEKKEEISSLKNEKDDLQNKVNSFDAEKQSILQEITSLKDERDDLTEKLKESEKNFSNEKGLFDELNTKYEKLLPNAAILNEYSELKMDKLKNAYEIFKNFKERTRNNLKAVFEVDSFFGFISNSMQWDRISGIWEQAKVKIVNDDIEDLKELRQLFLILFEIYNAGYNDAPYILITPEIGMKYNRNEQLIKNQKSDGKISEVLLEGYIAKKTNTVHKSIINVE